MKRKHFHIVIHIAMALLLYLREEGYPQSFQQVTAQRGQTDADSSYDYPLAHFAAEREYPVRDDRIYELDEVSVTALRFQPSVAESSTPVTLIMQNELDSGTALSLADAVSPVPGVFVKNYGGLSALKTISQRGLGAEHTLVLLNGMRVSSFQNGLVDLGLYPVGEIERIEVLHGGHSAIHGSDAIGGVVNVLTLRQKDPLSVDMEASFGSFDYQNLRVWGGTAWDGGGVRASLGNERSQEDYSFIFRNGPSAQELQRTNADFSTLRGSVNAFVDLNEGTRLSSDIRALVSERGVPGPVLSGSGTTRSRQEDEDIALQMTLVSQPADNEQFTIGWQSRSTYQRYTDPDLRIGQTQGLDTYFRNTDHRVSGSFQTNLTEALEINAGVEGATTGANGTSVSESISRLHGSTFLAGKLRAFRYERVLKEITFYPSVRFDSFSDSSPAWSPSIGIVVLFDKTPLDDDHFLQTHIRASASRNFRVPTFNELYYSGGGGFGNPLLRPEHSAGFEIGGGITTSMLGFHNFRLTYFDTEISDRIVWVAAGSFGVTPKNIRRVRSNGFEGTWSWNPFPDHLSLRLSYSQLSSRKLSKESDQDPNVDTQLPYVPTETAGAIITWSAAPGVPALRSIGGSGEIQFVGERFTTEDNKNSLPSFSVINLSLLAQWDVSAFDLRTKLAVRNLLDEEYQAMLAYPMPPRSFVMTFLVGI